MINSPNKLERYTAGLRLRYQHLILKNGIKNSYIKAIRKIHEIEAININYLVPVNIEKHFGEILTAVFMRQKFDYFINVKNNRLINKKLFTVLIINITTLTDYLEITEINNRLVIKGKFNVNQKIKSYVKILDGYILKFKGINYLIFNAVVTQKETENFESVYYLLKNPLSVVNLYLSDL
ncbi:MAG: hypothetical protein IJO62_02330 [Clostridia bacterium]|nr:hypothetical protein [Clostridia bacterium]